MKKILALILALMMVLSLMPATVWAEGMTDIDDVELRLVWHGDDLDPNQQVFSPRWSDGEESGYNMDQQGTLVYVYTGDKNGLTKEALEEQLQLNTSGPTFLENVSLNAPVGYQLKSYTASDRNHGQPIYPDGFYTSLRLSALIGEGGRFSTAKIDYTVTWEEIENTENTYTDEISVRVENPFGGDQGGGSERPEGTSPISIYDDKDKKYYNGVGVNQGQSRTFDQLFDEWNGNAPITGFAVEGTTTEGLTAAVNGNSLTVTASASCATGEQYVVVSMGDVRYSLRIMVNQSGGGQDGPPPFVGTVYSFIERNFIENQGVWSPRNEAQIIASEWGSFGGEVQSFALQEFPWLGQVLNDIDIVAPITKRYILSSDTAIDITIPECLVGKVFLPDELATNNVLNITFRDGLTAQDWENVYYGSMMRNFAMLSYTFRYIGEMKNPAYYTWNGQNGNSVEEEARRAEELCKFGHDRGITNAIVVANFQNDGEMMVLPGNTNVNATSHEIIRWQGSPNAYSFLTDIVDTSNVEAMGLDINPTENYGKNGNWLDRLGMPVDSSRISLPQGINGVNMTVSDGLVWAYFDTAQKLNLEQVLAATVSVTAPANALRYRIVNNYTSTEPGASPDSGSDWEVNAMEQWLEKAEWQDVKVPITLKPNTLEKQTVGNISYYIGENITGVHCYVIEWEMNDGGRKTEYIYFNADPYVCTVTTDAVDDINDVIGAVENPIVVVDSDIKLTTRKYPQNENGRYFFKLEITDDHTGNVIAEFDGKTLYRIILPYAFMGEEWSYTSVTEAGMKPPIINHYDKQYHQLVGNEGAIEGVFTERGIEFTVKSFSPFMLTWGEEGDVDMNTVDENDLRMLLRYLAKIDTLTKEQEQLADVDGVSGVNAADATVLARMIKKQ